MPTRVMSTRIDSWDQRYRAGEQVLEKPAPLVVEFTKSLAPGTVLDLASGPGRNAVYLAGLGWRVTAVDGSPTAIELLRASNSAIDARLADLEAGEFEIPAGAFDLVLSCYYLQRSLIAPIKAALRPGGLLIMIVLLAAADQPQGAPTRACPGELQAFFEGWRILHYRESGDGRAIAELVAQKPAWPDTKGPRATQVFGSAGSAVGGGALDGTGPRGWFRVASQRRSTSSSVATSKR
jgi:SAM-dependent methyltransferase